MTLLINPIAVPLQIGCYEADRLRCSRALDGRASDVLLGALEVLLAEHDIDRILYVNGPGSYMAIKLTYLRWRRSRCCEAFLSKHAVRLLSTINDRSAPWVLCTSSKKKRL